MAESKQNNPYLKKKLKLYFDENIPRGIIDDLRSNRSWRSRCKIFSAYDSGLFAKDDQTQIEYCKKHGLILVTLDKHFMDDRKFPFSNIHGIIRIVAHKNSPLEILDNLKTLLEFITNFQLPQNFMGETKIEVDTDGCKIRGRHLRTREIVSMTISKGDKMGKVMDFFGIPFL